MKALKAFGGIGNVKRFPQEEIKRNKMVGVAGNSRSNNSPSRAIFC